MKKIIETKTFQTINENGNNITTYVILSTEDKLFIIEIFDSSKRYFKLNTCATYTNDLEYYKNLFLTNQLKLYYQNETDIDPQGYIEIDIVLVMLDGLVFRQYFCNKSFDFFEFLQFEVNKLKNKQNISVDDFNELENKIIIIKNIVNDKYS